MDCLKIRGSNASIPDLLAQHSARSQTNERLSSRRTRPSSGKKFRPQSAKESGSRQGSQLPPKAPSIGGIYHLHHHYLFWVLSLEFM